MDTPYNYKKGEMSEWNEGNFKSLRLHQIQTLMNQCSMNPFSRMNNKYGYEVWFDSINLCYAEGQQKYNDKEITECKEMKEKVKLLFKDFKVSQVKSYGKKKGISYDIKKWETLQKELDNYGDRVRKLNDVHGLSTRNAVGGGMF